MQRQARFWMTIVTSAASHFWLAVTLQPGTVETLLTLPTLTPAIRTNEFGRRPLALANTACTVYGLANGFANFVNPRYVNTRIATIAIEPGREGAHASSALASASHGFEGLAGSCGPVWGLREKVSPAGTRVRPWNVGP